MPTNIYQDDLVELTYDKEKDILIVAWSNKLLYSSLKLQVSMHKVIEAINKYQCRNLVIDASDAVAIMDETSFRTSLAGFILELSKTKIQKLARIFTPYPAREEKIDSLQDELSIPFQMRDFDTREEAINWMNAGQE